MKILYAANIRLPTEKAHGAQIMHAVASLVEKKCDVELVVPTRKNSITDDAFTYYGIETQFPIRRLFSFDTVSFGRIGFMFQSFMFAVGAALYSLRDNEAVLYTRDEITAAIAIMCGKKKVFWESHDGSWNVLAQFTAKHAAGMVTVTQGGKNFYIEKGVPVSKILTLPNGVDIERFKTNALVGDVRDRLSIPRDAFVALYVGALDGWKGVEALCEVSRILPKEVSVVVVGGYENQIKKYANAYPNVLFAGPRPFTELPEILAAADVCVLPNTAKDRVSVTFTCPLKLLAYMAAGKPIVASDLPSIRELTGNDAALLVEPDNSEALAKGIMFLKENEGQREAFASFASMRVQKFSWDKRALSLLPFVTSVK